MNIGRHIHLLANNFNHMDQAFYFWNWKMQADCFWKRLLKTHALAAFLFVYFLFFCKKYVVFLYECFLRHKYGVQFLENL